MDLAKTKIHGSVTLHAHGSHLQGPLQMTDSNGGRLQLRVIPTGFELTAERIQEAPAPAAGFFKRLLGTPAAKPAAPNLVTTTLPLGLLSEAFRENDHITIDYDPAGGPFTLICQRNNQLGFAIGDLAPVMPLKGAANILFESLLEEPAPKNAWTLTTSLRPLELKPGKTVGLGYYSITLWKKNFCSIVRTDVSVRPEDIKFLANRVQSGRAT
jgi:hypothetical protein